MINYKIEVEGIVQGVGFRYATFEKANVLGIKGTVQNLDDGSVLIYASALPKNMQAFLNWCHIGPKAAKVIHINTQEISDLETNGFKIVR